MCFVGRHAEGLSGYAAGGSNYRESLAVNAFPGGEPVGLHPQRTAVPVSGYLVTIPATPSIGPSSIWRREFRSPLRVLSSSAICEFVAYLSGSWWVWMRFARTSM